MNSRLMQHEDRKPEYVRHDEPDRIPGTSKVRTWAGANPYIFSKESTLDKLWARARLCRNKQEEEKK